VRAEALANMLRDSKINVIYTTEFKRTQQTAAPLAAGTFVCVLALPAHSLHDAHQLNVKCEDLTPVILPPIPNSSFLILTLL
jgi:hypothetical protein